MGWETSERINVFHLLLNLLSTVVRTIIIITGVLLLLVQTENIKDYRLFWLFLKVFKTSVYETKQRDTVKTCWARTIKLCVRNISAIPARKKKKEIRHDTFSLILIKMRRISG